MSTEKKHSLPNKIQHLTDMRDLPVRIGEDPEIIKKGREVIVDNDEEKLLVTRTSSEIPGEADLIQSLAIYHPSMVAGMALGQLWRQQQGVVTVHDSRTGLPDYEVEYGGVLGKKVKAVTKWQYPVIKDEENMKETIYGIRKTKIQLSRSTYHETTTVSELPRGGGMPKDVVTVTDHKAHYPLPNLDNQVDTVADDVIAQIRRLPDFTDIRDPRKHRKLL